MEKILNFINGQLTEPMGSEYMDNYSPWTGAVYSKTPLSGAEDVNNAASSSQEAFLSWSNLSVQQRAEWMFKIADELIKHKELLAQAESKDQGKTLSAALFDVERSASFFQFFANLAVNLPSEELTDIPGHVDHIERIPIGSCALVTPWNYPLSILSWKLAPCLMAGNTAICKPSEITPYSAFLLCQILQKIDFPKGVVNVLHGPGASVGYKMTQHPLVQAISFTGGTRTGLQIANSAAQQLKKVSLELGGKNPNIIFSDCNFEKAIETSIRAAFLNQGEICLSGSKILVEESLFEKYVKEFVAHVRRLKMGAPDDPATFIGALASKQHLEKVKSYIELARQEGASLLTEPKTEGLPSPYRNGFFISPVVITNVQEESVLLKEEIFGPVVTINSFKNEAHAIELANSTQYGLSASIWTLDLLKAKNISKKIEAGTVWINSWMHRNSLAPFGGLKKSGLGYEGGRHSLDFFSHKKNISIRL